MLAFLYHDDALIALAKPPGRIVVPGRGAARDERCLRDDVAAEIGRPVFVVHRLDRGTSGVLLFALTAEAHRALSIAFAWRALERFGGGGEAFTALELRPRSGRLHQVRAHLASIGHPLAVDPDYGGAEQLAAGAGIVLARPAARRVAADPAPEHGGAAGDLGAAAGGPGAHGGGAARGRAPALKRGPETCPYVDVDLGADLDLDLVVNVVVVVVVVVFVYA